MKTAIGVARLNPEPTDLQRAIWRRHHKAGTAPGNPKYYRPHVLPAPPKPWAGQKAKYPALPSGAEWLARNRKGESAKDPIKVASRAGGDARAYVAAYDAQLGFKPEYCAAFAAPQ